MRAVCNQFNNAHPPFATHVDELPESPTLPAIIGEVKVAKEHFDLVLDPAYLWQSMPEQTPRERELREKVRQAKNDEIEHYVIRRERYWEMIKRLQFAEDMEYEFSIRRGFETTHQQTESSTRTEIIGLTLGLRLSGDLFNSAVAKKAVAFMLKSNGKAETSAEFTYQLSNELRFERMDTETYTEETTITMTTTFVGGHVYYVWSLTEALLCSRKRPGLLELEPMSSIIAATPVEWTDKLQIRSGSAP